MQRAEPPTGATGPDQKRWLRRAAGLMRRFPFSGRVVQGIVRVWQPRFSVGVVGVLLDDSGERVFLVEHVFHASTPWGLPGGWIARGEEPARCVEREFREETGLAVRAVRPLLVKRGTKWRAHMDVVFLCELLDNQQAHGDSGALAAVTLNGELLGWRWAGREDLPPLVDFHREAIAAAWNGTRAAVVTHTPGNDVGG